MCAAAQRYKPLGHSGSEVSYLAMANKTDHFVHKIVLFVQDQQVVSERERVRQISRDPESKILVQIYFEAVNHMN